MTISAEQRAWLKNLGTLVGTPPGNDDAPAKAAAQTRVVRAALADAPADGVPAGQKEGLVGFGPEDILPVVPGLIDEATQRRATCAIHNNTNLVLKLDTASLQETDDESGRTPGLLHGKYIVFPPSQVGANDQSGRFVAENNKFLIFSTTGVEGRVRYILDPQGTAWTIHFNNPFGATGEKNSADARVEGPNAAQFESPRPGMSGKSDVKYLFVLNAKGGPGPGPGPAPGPTPGPAPAPGVAASCLITVVNQTDFELTRAEAEHERGDFMVPPPRTVAPNSVVNFASVETPGAKEQGCKGFIVWDVGSPAITRWRIEWDNPEAAKNNSVGALLPPVAGLRSQDVIGQGDENVTVSFALSGTAPTPGPGPGPGPGPVPPPEPEVPFEPPVETKQPTFRKNDKSVDGWIEYAQMLLNFHLGTSLKPDGVFGSATHAAVLKFQQKKKLQVDGVIGNQTWAALREGAPEKPSTDGRQPHTFVEKGVEARWSTESDSFNFYFADTDELSLSVSSVGDTPIDPATQATVRVTPPGGKAKAVKVALGAGTPNSPGQGAQHGVVLKDFRKRFPSVPADAPVTDYLIEAYLPADLGGDFYSGKVQSA